MDRETLRAQEHMTLMCWHPVGYRCGFCRPMNEAWEQDALAQQPAAQAARVTEGEIARLSEELAGMLPSKRIHALRALLSRAAPSVPEGWRPVPVEPTLAIKTAMANAFEARKPDGTVAHELNRAKKAYAAMLVASPQPSAQQAEWDEDAADVVRKEWAKADPCLLCNADPKHCTRDECAPAAATAQDGPGSEYLTAYEQECQDLAAEGIKFWKAKYEALLAGQAATGAQEPFGYMCVASWGDLVSEMIVKVTRHPQPKYGFTKPIFTAPQAATGAQGLTDKRINELFDELASHRNASSGSLQKLMDREEAANFAAAILAQAAPSAASRPHVQD